MDAFQNPAVVDAAVLLKPHIRPYFDIKQSNTSIQGKFGGLSKVTTSEQLLLTHDATLQSIDSFDMF